MHHQNCLLERGFESEVSTWSAALPELELLVRRLLEHGRAYALIGTSAPEDAFVQIGISSEGIVRVEAAADLLDASCCSRRHPLRPAQAERMLQLGWRPPTTTSTSDPYLTPLWWREPEPWWGGMEMLVAELLVRTLVEVFETSSPSQLSVTLGSLPREGGFSRAS